MLGNVHHTHVHTSHHTHAHCTHLTEGTQLQPSMFGWVTVHVTGVSGTFRSGTDSIMGGYCVGRGLWHHGGGGMTLQTYSLSEKNTLFDNTQTKKHQLHSQFQRRLEASN